MDPVVWQPRLFDAGVLGGRIPFPKTARFRCDSNFGLLPETEEYSVVLLVHEFLSIQVGWYKQR